MFLCNDLFSSQVFMTSHESWDKKNFHLLGSNMQQYQMCWYHIFWWKSFLWLSFYHSGKYKFKTNERVFQLPFSANKIQTESSKNTIFLMWFKAITHQDTKFNCGKLTRNSEFFWSKLVIKSGLVRKKCPKFIQQNYTHSGHYSGQQAVFLYLCQYWWYSCT